MKVEKTVELPNGTVTFQGELTDSELDTVITYGLNTLLALGALKPTVITSDALEEFEEDEDKDSTLQ